MVIPDMFKYVSYALYSLFFSNIWNYKNIATVLPNTKYNDIYIQVF